VIDAIDGKDMPDPRPEMTVEEAKAVLYDCTRRNVSGAAALAVLTGRITTLERIIRVRLGPGAVPTTSIHSGRPLYDDKRKRP
jgi:hypothetical protein